MGGAAIPRFPVDFGCAFGVEVGPNFIFVEMDPLAAHDGCRSTRVLSSRGNGQISGLGEMHGDTLPWLDNQRYCDIVDISSYPPDALKSLGVVFRSSSGAPMYNPLHHPSHYVY